ncbi:FAD/NAD(P)-binding domain-containing protein [Trametes cingulata]|nr:FAD/NAD(P)-binding domain-containing protein [Trametes cingulata]
MNQILHRSSRRPESSETEIKDAATAKHARLVRLPIRGRLELEVRHSALQVFVEYSIPKIHCRYLVSASERGNVYTLNRKASGGGIAGLTLAATLHRYTPADAPIEVNIYEADAEVRTVGAGITIWPRTWAIMRELGLYDALWSVTVQGSGESLDGKNESELKPAFVARKANQPSDGYTYARVLAPNGSTTTHRRDMIDVFLSRLPPSYTLHTSKRLKRYTHSSNASQPEPGPVTLHFEDGTTAHADVLLGADGIHSATRYAMYEEAHLRECVVAGASGGWQECDRCKAAMPVWTGVHSYRCLIPTEELYALNPEHTTRSIGSVLCYSGKDKHIITYQISGGAFLNFVAICRVPGGEGAPYKSKWVTEVPKEEVLSQFAGWEPEVQQMLQCVRNPTRWAVHVVEDLPFAVRENVALVGDSMHAMRPNFGAGGGQAIEDAYILGRLLASPRLTRAHIPGALQIYERVRLAFTTAIARRAREVGLMYEFNAPGFYSGEEGREKGEDEEEEELNRLGRRIREMWEWQWTEGVEGQWVEAERELDALVRAG